MSRIDPALRALLNARLAGVAVVRQGGDIHMTAAVEPPADIIEALLHHKPRILEILAAERCEGCRGIGSLEQPLIEASYAGHWLLLHATCIASFLASERAASDRFALQYVCDFCGIGPSGGRMETVGYRDGPVAGVPVHLACLVGWFERLDQIPSAKLTHPYWPMVPKVATES
jgi:hypothetical protein